jgi:hypothetical protein
MLWLYLPEANEAACGGWSAELHAQAGVLVHRLLDEHGADGQPSGRIANWSR